MAQLSAARATPRRDNRNISVPVAATTTLFGGGLVSLLNTGGNACPAGTASSGAAIGVAKQTTVNSGAAGAVNAELATGIFRFGNSGSTDTITRVEIGKTCFIVDDQTVAKTDNSAARAAAGKVIDVDAQGVWVDVGR